MLRENLRSNLKLAIKAKESRRVATLRLILAALKDRDIQARGDGNNEGIDDNELMQLLETMVRQREEAIILYNKGDRPELANQEQEEIDIIREFMPDQLDDIEINNVVSEAIEEIGANTLKDMGPLMALLRKKYSGKMNFAQAAIFAKEKLS
ncbi:GatB/YqeY domain-containing protein [Alphaproteobacteria bacterium]|nr:GatB/YqeY domain-containing protein [Alphaproteobacteria bacterium]